MGGGLQGAQGHTGTLAGLDQRQALYLHQAERGALGYRQRLDRASQPRIN